MYEPGELFAPFALHYIIDQLTGVQGDTKTEYGKPVHQKLSPWFRYPTRDGEGGLTSGLIRTWVNDLEAGRLPPHDAEGTRRRKPSPKTIRNVHGLLSGICRSAVERNPPRHLDLP
ncbi:hypothetical protein [Streptomyces sp. NPDC051776]|uniref:hypothetical protein n=1 Tax=Streptomyces sp. NPDC051776 TaxID=3155414 RepID=UPI00341B22EC